MSELQAGPEMDQAVAKAIGKATITIQRRGKSFVAVQDGPSQGECCLWSPSTDLNAAFAAAERFGLFDNYAIGKFDGLWCVLDPHDPVQRMIDGAPSFCVAVCRMILTLSKKKNP